MAHAAGLVHRDVKPNQHERTASYAMTLGKHLVRYAKHAEAEDPLRRSHAMYVAAQNALPVAESAVALAEALLGLMRPAEVDALLAPLVDAAPAPYRVTARRRLAAARVQLARYAEAEPLLQQAWDELPDGEERQAVAGELIALFEGWSTLAPHLDFEPHLQLWRSRRGG